MSKDSYRGQAERKTLPLSGAMLRTDGQAAVEFALVLIVAMIVLFVAIQMAVIGQAALALGQMNYQGARYAAINTTATCTNVADYMRSVGSPTVTKAGVRCDGTGGVSVVMTCPASGGGTCPTTGTGRAFGDPVQVSLTFNATSLLFLSPNFLGISLPTTLTSTETAMSE
jgi:Flp pilus assembly protein TadG